MRFWVDGTEVSLDAVDLDDLGWDHSRSRGDRVIIVELTKEDLADVGSRLHALARELENDEPGYFDDPLMHDVPVPPSTTVFADDPVGLLAYLRDSFWSREAVLAVLRRADACRLRRERPDYLLQHLTDGEAISDGLRLTLGAVSACR